ncbi:MAG: 23S rRNA (pseudouridine(1915)-N(3))-methyltransferase RlmH [Thermoplasmata archaeon]
MRIKLICVGRVKEQFIAQGCSLYLERLERLQRLEVIEVTDLDTDKEGKLILAKCKELPIYAFSEEGEEFTSIKFADLIRNLTSATGDVAFVIGGPDGLSDEVKKKAKKIISLSKMTFTHEMARLILLEQIYRAVAILKGMPYHK